MKSKVLAGLDSPMEYLHRLSVVFAVELRLRIITELYMREMSPKMFFEECGGGSISRVDRHFKVLEAWGWLRLIRSETGGRRRGGTEHFYRAPELAVFDAETWSRLPYSVRLAFSWKILKQHTERVSASIQAGALDLERGHHTCTDLVLDQFGWDRVIGRFDCVFGCLSEEQADSRLRIGHSGGVPQLGTVALMGFESPAPGAAPIGPQLLETDESPYPFALRLSKVIGDETCLRILEETNLHPTSAREFHEKYGGQPDGVRRRFKLMERTTWLGKWLEKTGGRRRGAVEKYYLPTGPALRSSNPWEEVPAAVRRTDAWEQFGELNGRVLEAMRGGTFDMRPDRYCTWSLLNLDRTGWASVNAGLEGLRKFGLEEQERAGERITESGEKPIRMTIGLTAVDAPQETAKEP